MTPFRQELYLILIRRLILGAVIGAFVWFFDFRIEKMKQNEILKTIIAEKRRDAVRAVWPDMHMLEYLCGKAIKTLEEARDKGMKHGNALAPEYAAQFSRNAEAMLSQTIVLASALDRHRFWLGSGLHDDLYELTLGWPGLVEACLNDDTKWPQLAMRVGEIREKTYRLRDELKLATPLDQTSPKSPVTSEIYR